MCRIDHRATLRRLPVCVMLTVISGLAWAEPAPESMGETSPAAEDPFESDVWNVSFCSVGTKWCLDGTAEFPETDSTGFEYDPAKHEEELRGFANDRVRTEPSFSDDDFALKDDSLQSKVESIDRLPFVTVWKSDKAHLFVGVDKSGTAGLHLAPKPK